MVNKVFLFDQNRWIFCSDVNLNDDVYTGWVENGAWYLVYDIKSKQIKAYQSTEEDRLGYEPITSGLSELIWMCYSDGIGYNQVIENAKERYKSGEEANYNLEPTKKSFIAEKYDDEVAF